MLPTNRAKLNDLFNFQGLRKRVIIAPEYCENDERLRMKNSQDEQKPDYNEYNDLDSIGEQFESYVRPAVTQKQWIADREHERREVDRLGDIVYFYEHKPKLTEFEKGVYKRLTRRDRSMQTDEEPESDSKMHGNRHRIPIIRLPTPLAMESVEGFLYDNHWRLVDLFRTLDRDKSWAVVKEDFMRLVEKEQLNITDAQAEELITCFCREAGVPLNYKKFARGRALYKKNMRDSANKTPSSLDTQLESEVSTTPSVNYLQLPPPDLLYERPIRTSTSSHTRSTKSSLSKNKRVSISTSRTDSKSSTYQ
ncbi:unnamed protein product [Rotaria socialis]|uniref:Uncharacterized protein n=1 Tax=Rotaria socialis TaxID=392032 RepID=A0A821B5K3_9BILA|nr:unnamed protein product [Rotaria socialis]CAF4587927.1 unnamed protein product [Rotaria socialis]